MGSITACGLETMSYALCDFEATWIAVYGLETTLQIHRRPFQPTDAHQMSILGFWRGASTQGVRLAS